MALSTPLLPDPASTYNPFGRLIRQYTNLHTWRGQFIVLMSTICILSAACSVSVAQAFSGEHDRFKTAAIDSAPSIVAAQDMQQAIQLLNATITDYIITGDSADPHTQTIHQQDAKDIATQKEAFRDGLYRAAHNVTYYDKGEDKEVQAVSRLYDAYSVSVEKILYAYTTQGSATALQLFFDPATGPSAILQGTSTTADSLQAHLDQLAQINTDKFNEANAQATTSITIARILIGLLGGVLVVTLGLAGGLLVQRTHRVINPLLVPALLIALVFVYACFSSLNTAAHDYTDATENAFLNGVNLAVQIKALARNANVDESLWIIDLNQVAGTSDPAQKAAAQKRADVAQQAFIDKQSRLEQVMQHAATAVTYGQENIGPMYDALNCYHYYDGQIRTLYQGLQNGKDIQVVQPIHFGGFGSADYAGCAKPTELATFQGTSNPALATQLDVGQSDGVFEQFITSADSIRTANYTIVTQKVNTAAGYRIDDHFNVTTQDASGYLGQYALLSWIIFPLIALAGAGGVLLRLRDF